jgi:hypothetical protein
MNTRHPEPAIVTHYRATLKAEPPRVCHTCDHYRPDGVCAEYNDTPPPEFASEPGGCALWEWEVPF